MRKLIIGLVFIYLLSGCQYLSPRDSSIVTPQAGLKEIAGKNQSRQTPVIKKLSFNIVKVVDGDTIDVTINGQTERVRLIGMDTPETVDPRKPVQCFGIEASNKAKEILTGQKVYLEADETQGERDKYDRLLRYVFLEDGTNFNEMMISKGYAHEYTYNFPYKYQSDFKAAEKQAMKLKKGLWADNACIKKTEAVPITEETA